MRNAEGLLKKDEHPSFDIGFLKQKNLNCRAQRHHYSIINVGRSMFDVHLYTTYHSLFPMRYALCFCQCQPSADKKGRLMGKVLRDYEVYLIYVDPDRCDSCEECVIMCPTDVFEMPHKAMPVRPQNCLGCLTCTAVCKSKAIIITEI